jgi:hypothetical protein
MAYLAGICKFDAKSCLKRHPDDAECEQLIAKYSSKACRFGDKCKTKGCLYQHQTQPVVQPSCFWAPPVPLHDTNAFPPLDAATVKDANESTVSDEAFPPLTATTTTVTNTHVPHTNDGMRTNNAFYTVNAHGYPPIGYGAPVWADPQWNDAFPPALAFSSSPYPMAPVQQDDFHNQTQQQSPNPYP